MSQQISHYFLSLYIVVHVVYCRYYNVPAVCLALLQAGYMVSFPLRGPGIGTLRLEAELLGCMPSIAIGIVSGHRVVDAREYIGVTKTDQSG